MGFEPFTGTPHKPDTVTFMGAPEGAFLMLAGHLDWYAQPGWMQRKADSTLLADLQTYEVAGSLIARNRQRAAYDYAHDLRREINRRKLTPLPSLRIPRCGVCSHGTEQLFSTSEATHDLRDEHDENKRVYPNLCVRCWSRLHIDSNEE